MVKKLNIKKLLFVILTVIVLFLMPYSIYCFALGNVPIFEDCTYMILRKNDFMNQFFINVYHGRYISNFIVCMLGSVIPKTLGLHPITFFQTVAPVLKGLFLFILYFQICRYCYRDKTYDLFIPVIILLMYIQFQFIFAFHYQDVEYCSFYGFIFPFIFFNLFWYKFISCENQVSSKDSYLLCFYAFLVGISTEFTNIVTYVALLILFFCKKELRKKILFPFISLSVAIGLYYTNNESLLKPDTLQTKGSVFAGIDSVLQIPSYIKPFFAAMKDLFFFEYKYYILLIIILSVIIYIQNKKFDKLIFPFSLLAGSLIFNCLLIGDVERNSGSWLWHFDIIYQYKIFFFIVIFLLLNNIKAVNFIKKSVIFIFLGLLTWSSSTNEVDFIKNIKTVGLKNAVTETKKQKMAEQLSENEIGYIYQGKNRYLFEKINVYNLKNNLPLSAVYNNDWNLYAIYTNDLDICSEIMNINYIYGLNSEGCNFRKFYSIKDAYNQYLKDGGKEISDDEINLADFQKLKMNEQM